MQSYLVIGGLFGFLSAIGAGLFDSQLLVKQHKSVDNEVTLGGPMLILAGIINSVVGIIAMIISLIVTGSLLSALFLGGAVLVGFVLGFLLLAVVLIIRDN